MTVVKGGHEDNQFYMKTFSGDSTLFIFGGKKPDTVYFKCKRLAVELLMM